jgi:hypothetical protein
LYVNGLRFVPDRETILISAGTGFFGKSKVQIHESTLKPKILIRGICNIAQVLGCGEQLLEAASDDSVKKVRIPVGYSLRILLSYTNVNDMV